MSRNIPSLTSIRGIAAMAVLFLHIDDTYGGLLFFSWFKNGALGVDLFFVLSGFILAFVYSTKFEKTLGFCSFYKEFIFARLVRIYPLHIVTLLFLVLLATLIPSFYARYENYFTFTSFIYNLLLIHNWGFVDISWNTVSWSISAEFFMYLVFPFLLLLKVRLLEANHIIIFLCAVAILASHHLVLFYFGIDGYGGMSLGGMVRVSFEFTLGFLIFFLREPYLKAIIGMGKKSNLFSFTFAAILLLAFVDGRFWYLFVPSAAMLILHLSLEICSLARVLSYRGAHLLGEISFSLYMWHWIIIQIQNWMVSESLIDITTKSDKYVASIFLSVLSLITAYLSYLYLELPSQKAGKTMLIKTEKQPT